MSSIPQPRSSNSWLTPIKSASAPATAFDTANAPKVNIKRTANTRPRSAGGVVPASCGKFSFTNEFAALPERRLLAVHRFHAGQSRAFYSQELVTHAMKMLADDVKPGFRQKMVDIRDAPVQRILDRTLRPIDDLRGSSRYRLEVSKSLVEKFWWERSS